MKTKFAYRSLVAACNTEISTFSGTTQHDQPKTTVLNTEASCATLIAAE